MNFLISNNMDKSSKSDNRRFFFSIVLGIFLFFIPLTFICAKEIKKPYTDVDRQFSREVIDIAFQLKDLSENKKIKEDIERAKAEFELAEKLIGYRESLEQRRPSYPETIELLTLSDEYKRDLIGKKKPYIIVVSAKDAGSGWIQIETAPNAKVSTKYTNILKQLLDKNIMVLLESSRKKARFGITSVGENLSSPLSDELSNLLLERKAELMDLLKSEGYELGSVDQIDVMILSHQIDDLTADMINEGYREAFKVFVDKELGETATLEDRVVLLDKKSDSIIAGLKELYTNSSGTVVEVSVLPTQAKIKKKEGNDYKEKGDKLADDSKPMQAKNEYKRARMAYEEAEKEYNKFFTRVLETIDDYLFTRFKLIYSGYIDSKNSVKGGTTTSIETAMNDVMAALFSANFRGDVQGYLDNAKTVNLQMSELYRSMGISEGEVREIDDLQRNLDLLMSRRKQAEKEENWKEVNSLYTLIQEKIREIEQMKIDRTLTDIDKIKKNYEFLYTTVSELINTNTKAYGLESYRKQCDDLYENHKSLKREGDDYYHYFRFKQQYRASYSRMKSFYGTVSDYIGGRINVDRRRLSVSNGDVSKDPRSKEVNNIAPTENKSGEEEWDPNWDGSENFNIDTDTFFEDIENSSGTGETEIKEIETTPSTPSNNDVIYGGTKDLNLTLASTKPFIPGKGSLVTIQYGGAGLYRLFVNRYYSGVTVAKQDAKKIGQHLGLTGSAAPFVINATDLNRAGVNKGYLIQIFSAKNKKNIDAFSKKLEKSM